MSPRLWSLLALVASASAQFGNLNVQWSADEDSASKDAAPRMSGTAAEKVAKPDGLTRRDGLASLSAAQLEEIVGSFNMKCETCTMLEMQLRQLKSQLSKRGIKCERCSQREHFIDRMLDHAHLPILNT